VPEFDATRWGPRKVDPVGWFSQKKEKPCEHAVIVHYELSNGEYGTPDEREAVVRRL
jgi:hypothetical protein